MKTKSQRGAATRQRLLEAASDLMGRRGFHGTSVDDVLTESAAGKSQFYHYFDSKNALVDALLEHHAPTMPLARLAAACTGVTSFERLEGELDQLVLDYEAGRYPNGCVIANLSGELAGDPAARESLAPGFQTAIASLAELVQRMRYRGHVRSDVDAQQTAYFIAATLQGAFLLARLAGDVAPLRAAARQLKAHVRSLSTRSTTPQRSALATRPLATQYCP